MKEIKFRAWNKHSKEMLEVILINFKDKYIEYLDESSDIKIKRLLLKQVELMQFSGVYDYENAIEIYESDIVEVNYEDYDINGIYLEKTVKGTVVFKNGTFEINNNIYIWNFDSPNILSINVIGNIYEEGEQDEYRKTF